MPSAVHQTIAVITTATQNANAKKTALVAVKTAFANLNAIAKTAIANKHYLLRKFVVLKPEIKGAVRTSGTISAPTISVN